MSKATESGVRDAAAKEVSRHTRNRLTRSAKGGQLLSALMLPFFAVRPPGGYAVITTTGRKTGKPRRKCLRAIRSGNTLFVVMLRPPMVAINHPGIVSAWVLNIRANPDVRCGFAAASSRAARVN